LNVVCTIEDRDEFFTQW